MMNVPLLHQLTIHPSNTQRLQYGKEKKSHPTTGVVVKQLEDVQSTLYVCVCMGVRHKTLVSSCVLIFQSEKNG